MHALIEARKDNTAEGAAKRQAIQAAMEIKNYEFNAHGVELGQHYDSSAIVGDGTSQPEPTRDPELYYEASTHPGGRLPHAWVGDSSRKLSTHDLAPYSQFTLFTGPTGQEWTTAAQKVSDQLGVTVNSVVIGPGQAITDLYFDWAKLRGVAEDGAVLVRPDKHVGWRADRLPTDPDDALHSAVSAILSRENQQ